MCAHQGNVLQTLKEFCFPNKWWLCRLPTGTVSSMNFVGKDDPLLWLCLPLFMMLLADTFPAVLFSDICSLGISGTRVTHRCLAPSALGSSPDPT